VLGEALPPAGPRRPTHAPRHADPVVVCPPIQFCKALVGGLFCIDIERVDSQLVDTKNHQRQYTGDNQGLSWRVGFKPLGRSRAAGT
jgi:hypothetical protein